MKNAPQKSIHSTRSGALRYLIRVFDYRRPVRSGICDEKGDSYLEGDMDNWDLKLLYPRGLDHFDIQLLDPCTGSQVRYQQGWAIGRGPRSQKARNCHRGPAIVRIRGIGDDEVTYEIELVTGCQG